MRSFKKIGIIGVGFMAGSLALSLKEKFPHFSIYGYARRKSSYSKLRKLNILDRVERDLKKVVDGSDIIILASPIYAIIDYFKKISPFLKNGAIVFDLGSSKELVEKAAKRYLPKNTSFVGCHPLCGSEKSGAEFSCSGLYKGAICIITSSPKNEAVKVIKGIWEKLGCRVIFLSSFLHDSVLSSVSHLPHLISFSLTNSVPKNYLAFSPSSLKDLTRISNSPPSVWVDIFLSNRKNLLRDTEKFIKTLKGLEGFIRGAKRRKLFNFIKKINKKQKFFLKPGMFTS